MKNAFLKLIAITLAVVMLSLCLFSCDETTSSDGSDTNTGNNVTQNEGSSNSSDNGNTDNSGNSGENGGENNGENGGNNTDSERVSKLKYNNTVAKTSYAAFNESLIKFTFNGEGKLLGFGFGLIPNDVYLPASFNELSSSAGPRIVYNAEGDPVYVSWISLAYGMLGSAATDLKPSADNTSFDGKMVPEFLADMVGHQVTFKITVDAQGRTTSFTCSVSEDGEFTGDLCFEFNGTEFSNGKLVEIDYEYADDEEGTIIGRHYDTTEFSCSKIGNTVMTTMRETDGKTGIAATKTVKMETKQEGDSYAIEAQYSDGYIHVYVENGNYVSASTSDGKINYSYTYDADGKLTLWNMGNGVVISFSYDEKGILTTAEAMRFADKQVAQKCIYKYNDNGFLIGYTVESNDGKAKKTVDFISGTTSTSIIDGESGIRVSETQTTKISDEAFQREHRREVFDKNDNKLFENIYEVEIKDASKNVTVPVTYNFWCDSVSNYEDIRYTGYLYARITGEMVWDIETMEPMSVNMLMEKFDANGNVISSATATDFDTMNKFLASFGI